MRGIACPLSPPSPWSQSSLSSGLSPPSARWVQARPLRARRLPRAPSATATPAPTPTDAALDVLRERREPSSTAFAKARKTERSIARRALRHEQGLERLSHRCRIPRRCTGRQPRLGRHRRPAGQHDKPDYRRHGDRGLRLHGGRLRHQPEHWRSARDSHRSGSGPRHGDPEARQRPLAHGLLRRRTNEASRRPGLRRPASRQHRGASECVRRGDRRSQVADWTAPDGHAFVGVQANGQWATPSSSGYCSEWQLKAVVAPERVGVLGLGPPRSVARDRSINFTNPRAGDHDPRQAGHGNPREHIGRLEPVSRRLSRSPGRAGR